MKKLKKFVLNSDVTRLTNLEQLNIVGGDTSSNSCSGKPYGQCSGSCYAFGYEGSCGWVKTEERCACAVVYIG